MKMRALHAIPAALFAVKLAFAESYYHYDGNSCISLYLNICISMCICVDIYIYV